MSSKEFCESGKHSYSEVDIVRSIITPNDNPLIVVACSKCDSRFLREVVKLL